MQKQGSESIEGEVMIFNLHIKSSISCLTIISLISTAHSLSKVVWSPATEQAATGYYTNCPYNICPTGEDPYHSPDFYPGQTEADREGIVDQALLAAYKKGIRSIDINFYAGPNTPATFANEQERAYYQSAVEQGSIWARRVEYFNNSSNVSGSDYFKLRIRLNATSQFLNTILYRSNRSKYASLPGFATAMRMDNSGNSVADGVLPDLGKPEVRGYVADYTKLALDGLFDLLSSRTTVEMVTLVLDVGGESSTYPNIGPNDPKVHTYFSDSPYPYNGDFATKVAHFKSRQADLKATYIGFANAVHNYSYNYIPRYLKAAVFMQTWAMDGQWRGNFDLAALLKSSGIDYIHHTQTPLSFDQSIRYVSYTASAANFLGRTFDTEFTWPWFASGDSKIMAYDPLKMTDNNADMFYFQAVSGFRYGATGFTESSWLDVNIMNPPNSASWQNVVGLPSPNWNSDYLTRTGSSGVAAGLLTYSPWSAATKAIYISTVGRIDCELNGTCFGTGAGAALPSWFGDFGLNYLGERIDIITDQMIKDAASPSDLFGKYQMVYLPYETGAYTDPTVFSKLDGYFYISGGWNVWYQQSPHSTVRGNYGTFRNRTITGISSF